MQSLGKSQTSKSKIYDMAIDILENDKEIYTISALVTFLPISNSTFYEYFPYTSDESEIFKKYIAQNKLRAKRLIQRTCLEIDKTNPALLIFMWKLLLDDDEKKTLYAPPEVKPEPIKHTITLSLPDGDLVDEIETQEDR